MEPNADRVEAFGDLYSATFTQLLGYCRRRSRSAADADDAVAETYIVAWRRIDDVVAADSPIAWLYGVAYRVLGNQYRAAGRAERLHQRLRLQPPRPPQTEPADVVATESEVVAVYEALARLDPRDQELIRLAALEELSYAEIATAMNMRIGAVRSRLFRARRRLTQILKSATDRDDRAELETESDKGSIADPPDLTEEQS